MTDFFGFPSDNLSRPSVRRSAEVLSSPTLATVGVPSNQPFAIGRPVLSIAARSVSCITAFV
jgi:hypothetical protein